MSYHDDNRLVFVAKRCLSLWTCEWFGKFQSLPENSLPENEVSHSHLNLEGNNDAD